MFGNVLKMFEMHDRNLLEAEHNVISHIFSEASGGVGVLTRLLSDKNSCDLMVLQGMKRLILR